MPATKEQPNLRLQSHFPDVAGGQPAGAVVPAHCVSDPDALVALGAAAWTGEPVTVQVAPPGAKAAAPAVAADPDELAAVRAQAEQVAEEKLKLEDAHAKLSAEKAAAEKELADLKAAVAAAKSLKDAQAAVK